MQTPAQRRRRQRDAVIEDILTVARDLMRADGVAALSLNEIARRLGMRTPSLYNYFPSKDAIYDELFRRGFVEFGRRMQERPGQAGALADRLRSVFATYLSFAQENPDLYQLMFQRPVPGFTPSAASMAASLAALTAGYREVAALVAAAELRPGVPAEQAADLLIALMHGLTELHLANNPDLPSGQGRFGQLVDPAVALLLAAWQGEGAHTKEEHP